jgi:hypothetical protein
VSGLTIEEEFQKSCELAVEECRRLSYVPNRLDRHDARARWSSRSRAAFAAKRRCTEGFERLIRMGRADLTVEQAVLDDRWATSSPMRTARPLSGV